METIIHSTNAKEGYILSKSKHYINITPYTNGTLKEFRSVEFYYISAEYQYKFRVFDINNENYKVTYPNSITVIATYYN